MARIQAEGSQDVMSLRPTQAFPDYRADCGYAMKALHAWVHRQARDIASRFDAHKGGTQPGARGRGATVRPGLSITAMHFRRQTGSQGNRILNA
jgi:hypothetical protein